MHEELIKRLRAEALFQRMSFSRDLLASELEEAATALKAQSAQLAERDAEMEQMTERVIQWGEKLIELGEGGACAVTCPECGFPVADYGVNADIYCSWCKAKSSSPNYVAAGPGYCTTSADRKSKTYDRLFHTGRTHAKQDEEG